MALYTTEQVRDLITRALSDEELTTLCFDHFPEVYSDFSAGMGRSIKVQKLIEHCARQKRLDELVRHVQKINPNRYDEFNLSYIEQNAKSDDHKDLMTRAEINIQVDLSEVDNKTVVVLLNAITSALEHMLGASGRIKVLQFRIGSIDLVAVMPAPVVVHLIELHELSLESPIEFIGRHLSIEKVHIIQIWEEPLQTIFISLPEMLQPAFLLPEVESGLASHSRPVVNRCKSVSENGNWQILADVEDEVNRTWSRYGDSLGQATANLWLADLYWRSEHLGGVLRHCKKALDLPGTPSSIHPMLVKAAAHYLIGLSHLMQNNLLVASEAFQEAIISFENAQSYWQRTGYNTLAEVTSEIVVWIRTLVTYADELRLSSPDKSRRIIYPLKTSPNKQYTLAEMALLASVNGYEMQEGVSDFLLRRSQARLSFQRVRQIGYRVRPRIRVFVSDIFKSFRLQALNSLASQGDCPILPAGVLYHLAQVDNQCASRDKEVCPGDYLLVCNVNPIVPDIVELVRQKGESAIYGSFERDTAGHIRVTHMTFRSIGQDPIQTIVDEADFVMRPA